MNISPQFLYEIASQLLNYNQLCDLFGLTEDERKNPNAGEWMIDRIKQYHTAAILKLEVSKKSGIPIVPVTDDQPNPLAGPLETPLKEE